MRVMAVGLSQSWIVSNRGRSSACPTPHWTSASAKNTAESSTTTLVRIFMTLEAWHPASRPEYDAGSGADTVTQATSDLSPRHGQGGQGRRPRYASQFAAAQLPACAPILGCYMKIRLMLGCLWARLPAFSRGS